MTRSADLAGKVTPLIEMTPGEPEDVVPKIDARQEKTATMPDGEPNLTDVIAVHNPVATDTPPDVKITLAKIKALVNEGGGEGGEITWQIGSGDGNRQGQLGKLIIGEGIYATQIDETTLEINIPTTDVPNFMSIARSENTTWATFDTPIEKTDIWLGENVMGDSPFIVGDTQRRAVYLTNRPNKQYDDYLIAVVLNLRGEADSDGSIRLFAMGGREGLPATEETWLVDINGEPVAFEKHYTQGDKLGWVGLAGIVRISSTTAITIHIRTDINQVVSLKNRLEAASSIIMQCIGGEDRALHSFQNETGINLKYIEYDFKNPLSDLSYILSHPVPKKTYTPLQHFPPVPGSDIFSDGSWFVIPLDVPVDITITDHRTLEIEGTSLNTDSGIKFPYFNVVHYIYEKDVKYLAGHGIGLEATLINQTMGTELSIVAWKGDGDPNENMSIIDATSNDQYKLAQGWVAVKQKAMAAGNEVTDYLYGIVPDGARMIALVLSPLRNQSPAEFHIKDLRANVFKEFTAGEITQFLPKSEEQLSLVKGYAKFVQSIYNYVSVRYTINSRESAAPMGVLQTDKLTLPVELDPKVNTIPTSQIGAGEGAIHFIDDIENVEINTSILIVPGEKLPAGSTATVTFKWYSFKTDGSMTEMPGSTNTVTIRKDSPAVTKIFSYKQPVIFSGTRLGLRMQTNGDDYAYLKTNQAHIPLIENIVSGDKI